MGFTLRKWVSSKGQAEYWKAEAKKYEEYYKREVLLNQTYSHAILQATLSGQISSNAQCWLYRFINNERQYIYKNVK